VSKTVRRTAGSRNGVEFASDDSLDQLDQFRSRGVQWCKETGDWMHAFSEILTAPSQIELLRVG
jgi:hypothetical protein